MRLRVTLSAQQPMTWSGRVSVSEGSVERVQPLSLDPSAAAGVSLSDDSVQIHHRQPQPVDYFDLTTLHQPGAELVITLQGALAGQRRPAT